MSFNKWRKVFKNEEFLEVCNDIQDYVIDEWNEEDSSVGIYAIDKINQNLVDDINENYDGCIVNKWEESKIILEISEKYYITIQMVKVDYDTCQWEIVDFKAKRNYKKIIRDL